MLGCGLKILFSLILTLNGSMAGLALTQCHQYPGYPETNKFLRVSNRMDRIDNQCNWWGSLIARFKQVTIFK